MSNKTTLLMISLMISIPCESSELYSNAAQQLIEAKDSLFFEKADMGNQELINTLKAFKESIINNNSEIFYQLRTIKYRETVPFENFRKSIIGGAERPKKIFFSLEGSKIGKNEAHIKSYYVMGNKKLETYIETLDNWIFDVESKKWFFVSNSLSWGSQVVIDAQVK